jgi:phosphoribosyl 1,2-cyclic phosphate phosphodiesterase
MIEHAGRTVLIDTSTDLRQQALQFGVRRVDAVVYTHEHADHVLGLDELRIFNQRQRSEIPCFGPGRSLEALRQMFGYAFSSSHDGGPRPRLGLYPVEARFEVVKGLVATPVPILHGELSIFGYRVGDFAYLTDCSRIPESSFALLEDLEVLVLGALRYRPHPTHFTIEQALAAADRIAARRTYFTHLTHDVDHARPEIDFPADVELAWDGMTFDVGE